MKVYLMFAAYNLPSLAAFNEKQKAFQAERG